MKTNYLIVLFERPARDSKTKKKKYVFTKSYLKKEQPLYNLST